jgi:hypothetical protein
MSIIFSCNGTHSMVSKRNGAATSVFDWMKQVAEIILGAYCMHILCMSTVSVWYPWYRGSPVTTGSHQ